MNKKKTIAIHILCWLIFLAYFYLGYFIGERTNDNGLYFGVTIDIVHIVEFYICYLWVFPSYLKRSTLFQLIGGILFALAVFIGLRYLIEEILSPILIGDHNYASDTTFWHYVRDNVYFGTSYIMIAAAIWSSEHSLRNERMNKQLRDEVVKAELSFLKSQINPHFLYNTLNYIYSLALPVSEKLGQAVLRLSDLMRYTLSESPDGKVSLVKEVTYLESYVELFRMRFEPKFYVRFETEGITEQQRVASLLLIPLIENAFKHGVLNDPENPVHIQIKVVQKELILMVSNLINRSQKDQSSGIGLVNVERRLQLIYPGKHTLEINNNGKVYKSTLSITL